MFRKKLVLFLILLVKLVSAQDDYNQYPDYEDPDPDPDQYPDYDTDNTEAPEYEYDFDNCVGVEDGYIGL